MCVSVSEERSDVQVGKPVLYSGTPDLEYMQMSYLEGLIRSVQAKPRIKH
jgi:hypothetical protein